MQMSSVGLPGYKIGDYCSRQWPAWQVQKQEFSVLGLAVRSGT
jgi:hypothetical protein